MTREALENYLNRWGLQAFAVVALIAILLFLASLAFTFWADEYATPAWNERSVPAPQTY